MNDLLLTEPFTQMSLNIGGQYTLKETLDDETRINRVFFGELLTTRFRKSTPDDYSGTNLTLTRYYSGQDGKCYKLPLDIDNPGISAKKRADSPIRLLGFANRCFALSTVSIDEDNNELTAETDERRCFQIHLLRDRNNLHSIVDATLTLRRY